jgi:transcriptional regulator with XRE-family HTH domain
MNRGALALKKALNKRGARAKLAKALEIWPAVVSRWLSGDRTPDTVQRAYIEDEYGVFWRLWDQAAPGPRRSEAA